MNKTFAMMTMAAAMLGAAPGMAEATVRYELQSQIYETTLPASVLGSNRQPTINLTFTVSDAAVARGSISVAVFDSRGTRPPTGDVADLISLKVSDDPLATPTFMIGNFDLRASFASGGSVTDFFLDYLGGGEQTRFRGLGGNLIGGGYGSDRGFVCGFGSGGPFDGSNCGVTGLIQVPEPASMALLGIGLLGMAAVRRR